jgi:Domain of unknown function DUF29
MSTLYDTDFYAWAQQQAAALRAKDWAALDIEHLAEEVEELRKTECRGIRSQLRLILSHLLRWVYQPDKRPNSWRSTIASSGQHIASFPCHGEGTTRRWRPMACRAVGGA